MKKLPNCLQKRGTYQFVKEAMVVEQQSGGEVDICLHQNHVHRIRRLNDNVYPGFYMYRMQTAFQGFKLYSGQTNNTIIPNLSIGWLKSFLVPSPPLPTQHRIANYLMEKMKEVENLKSAIQN